MKIDTAPNSGIDGFILRNLERTDVPDWYRYLSRPEVLEFMGWSMKDESPLHQLFSGFENASASSARRLALIDQKSNRLAGTIGLYSISLWDKRAEISYDLDFSYWGQGVATTLCNSVVTWAFEKYDFFRIQGTIPIKNDRSARVLEKINFKYEGLLRGYLASENGPVDCKIYARLQRD